MSKAARYDDGMTATKKPKLCSWICAEQWAAAHGIPYEKFQWIDTESEAYLDAHNDEEHCDLCG